MLKYKAILISSSYFPSCSRNEWSPLDGQWDTKEKTVIHFTDMVWSVSFSFVSVVPSKIPETFLHSVCQVTNPNAGCAMRSKTQREFPFGIYCRRISCCATGWGFQKHCQQVCLRWYFEYHTHISAQTHKFTLLTCLTVKIDKGNSTRSSTLPSHILTLNALSVSLIDFSLPSHLMFFFFLQSSMFFPCISCWLFFLKRWHLKCRWYTFSLSAFQHLLF